MSSMERFPQDAQISRLFHVEMPSGVHAAAAPPANPQALDAIRMADMIVYGIGSLFTSVVVGLLPQGFGEAVRENHAATKVLILNGYNDRETGGFHAIDYISAVARIGRKCTPANRGT